MLLEAAHPAHVLLAAQGVDDAAGGQEEQALEEGVGHQVEQARGVGPDAAADEHVADLGDGRIGQDALDVVLDEGHGRGEDSGDGPDPGYDRRRGRGGREQPAQAADHVDAGRDHGRGVDEGGDRGRALHGVGQPDVERDLGRFPGRADEEKEGDEGEQRRERDAPSRRPR